MLSKNQHLKESITLLQLMKQEKLKIKQLASITKTDRNTLSKAIHNEGNLSIDKLEKILNVMGYSLELNITKQPSVFS